MPEGRCCRNLPSAPSQDHGMDDVGPAAKASNSVDYDKSTICPAETVRGRKGLYAGRLERGQGCFSRVLPATPQAFSACCVKLWAASRPPFTGSGPLFLGPPADRARRAHPEPFSRRPTRRSYQESWAAVMMAAWPTIVTRSRWPLAFARSTQKPFWNVTRSTRPARTS